MSRDGIELRFAVNRLAAYRLARRLIPLLAASAPSRIVQVASAGQEPLDFDDPMVEVGYDGSPLPAQQARAGHGHLRPRRRVGQLGITANALHSATFMDTAMVRDAGILPTSSVEVGLEATLRLTTDPELDGVTGRGRGHPRHPRVPRPKRPAPTPLSHTWGRWDSNPHEHPF